MNDFGWLDELPDYGVAPAAESVVAPAAPAAEPLPIPEVPVKSTAVRSAELDAFVLAGRYDTPEIRETLGRNKELEGLAARRRKLDGLNSRAVAGQTVLRYAFPELKGEPGAYFTKQGKELPECQTRTDAFAAVYDDYLAGVEAEYKKLLERRAAWQAHKVEVSQAVVDVVAGRTAPAALHERLTPEQMEVYQKEFDADATEKAGVAMGLLREAFAGDAETGLKNMVNQGLANRVTAALSDLNEAGELVLNEKAVGMFQGALTALMQEAKGKSGEEYKFLHNLLVGLGNPVRRRSKDIQGVLGLMVQADTAAALAMAGRKVESQEVQEQMQEDIEELRGRWRNDEVYARLRGMLDAAQSEGNATAETADFLAKSLNVLGSVVGQTAPFFVPGVGAGIAFLQAFDEKRNAAYFKGLKPGTAEWSAFIDAATSVAVEKIAFGSVSRVSGTVKLLEKVPGYGPVRNALLGSFYWRAVAEVGAGVLEESAVEPSAEALLQWMIRGGASVWGDVGGRYDWAKYAEELKGMFQPEQLAATVIFGAGLTGMQSPLIKDAAKGYSRHVEYLMGQGIGREEARNISAMEDAEERVKAAAAAKAEAWKDPEVAKANQRAAAVAFAEIAEARAVVESRAYAELRQELRLPEVEKVADKEGRYLITTYNRVDGTELYRGEVGEEQLLAMLNHYIKQEDDLRVRRAQSAMGANAMLRAVEATGEVVVEDMGAAKNPESGERVISELGAMGEAEFRYAAELALDEFEARKSAGMSEGEALATPFEALSRYMPLGSWLKLEAAFKQRLATAGETSGEEGADATRLLNTVPAAGTTKADTLFLAATGQVGAREVLEDTLEHKQKKVTGNDPAKLQAWHWLLKDAQKEVRRLGFNLSFYQGEDGMDAAALQEKVTEGMSKLASAHVLANADALPLPAWVKELLRWHMAALEDAAGIVVLAEAYRQGRERGNIGQEIEEVLADLGKKVASMYAQAELTEADVQAYRDARARYKELTGDVTPSAEEVRAEQDAADARERERVTSAVDTKSVIPPSDDERTDAETFSPAVDLPEEVRGVFPKGASYNIGARTWLGMVPVARLHLSPDAPQVKVGSNKKGVVNPLVGDYRADAPPVYVWQRKNGTLEVISGRHRLDLAKRTGTEMIAAYVYQEDLGHDAKWARLLDFEQNMQDDQADELTAAIYVRETGLNDEELTRRGLTRGGSRSARGILIGREAREDLWSRFQSRAIDPRTAEAICRLTMHMPDKGRIDAMQAMAAADLARGKSLEHVAAKLQLMAHADADGEAQQGLLSFGESFDEAMERSAEYIARCIEVINRHISAVTKARSLGKGGVSEQEGISVGLDVDPKKRLVELNELKAAYEKCGFHENIRFRALTWDGRSDVDPIGDYAKDKAAAAALEGPTAEELEAQACEAAAEATGTFGFSVITQKQLVDSLKAKPELQGFMDCVQRVELMKERNSLDRKEYFFGALPAKVINEVQKELPANIDLAGARLSLNAQDVWHMYRGHCLDSFMYDDQVSITFDDIRMIPDIIDSYDSVKAEKESGKWKLVFLKKYGDITYKYISEISRKHDWSKVRHATLKTGWLIKSTGAEGDFTSRQSQTQTVSHFPRTAIVTPLEVHIKQNYKDEARNIALYAKNHDTALIAPNGKVSNLTPVQWLAVRLQSFKTWFGDWENDPENASKIVDENGEPLVVYHGSPHYGFTVFDKARRGERDKGDFGRGFYFTPNRGYAATYGKEGYWNAEGDDSKVYACFLNIREPMQVQARQAENMERWRFEDAEGVMVYTDKFYDLAWNDVKNLSEIVVHESNQIKSATDNRGTFDGGSEDINFSVIGPKAKTWDRYKERAFKGRDDGKMRVELDTSQAKLKKAPLHRLDDSLVREVERRLAFFREELEKQKRWEIVSKLWAAGEYDLRTYDEMSFLRRVLHGAGIEFRNIPQMAELGVCALALDGDAAKRLLKVVDMPGVEGFNRLGEVLNFPELYEAYPELKKLPVRWMDDSFRYKGSYLTGGRFAEPCIFAKLKRTDGGKLSTLLHEVQHWIQHREGFAYGAVPGGAQAFLRRAGHPAAEEDNLYKRFSGEIEARNVQARRWMSADERAELPFNETLEHPGRAISYSLDEIMAVGFSVTSMSDAAQGLLEGNVKVSRAEELVKDFNAQIANWNRVAAGKQGRADARTGAEMFGAVQALLSSARRVLPEGYRANVYTLMQWASVYAGMAETGQLPAAGALKGKPEILEAFKRKMLNETSMAANQAEAEAMLASIGEQKLNEVMVKVLQQVRGQLVRYAKDELWSKVLKVVDRAYAKDEAGKKPRRGKMAAVDYARLEQVLKLLRMDPEEVREEMNGLQGKISEATAERAAELEAELQDLSVFGGWSGMSLQQAMAAHEALVLLVSTGRTSWQKQLDRRKAEIEWLAREMSRALPTDKTVSGTRNAERTRLWRALKRLPYGFMSYSQLMLALSDRLGEQFCFDRIQEMTDANAALLNAEKDRMSWMLKLVQKVSGKQGEVACEKWLADFDTPEDTKIVLSPMSWCEVTMTVEAAEAWLAAGKEERTRQWEERRKDEDRLKRSLREERPMVPEELIPELRKAVKEYKGNKRKKSGKVTVRGEYEEKGRAKTLTCSRDAALYAILLHEQDDYSTVFVPGRPDEVKHGLLYREGLNTPAKIQQLYDFVGPAGLAYGYALRKRLQEQGLTVGQVWEAREGVPFKYRDNYFRASFDRLAIQDKNPLTDGRVNGMGGGKYGMLVNRVPTHQEPAKWDMGASMVFLAASLEQDNYIFTSHITDRWRKLLMQREFARRLQAYVGDDVMRKLVLWMDAIDGAPLDNMSAFMNLSHWQGFFTGAWAASVLNGNGYVLMKQSSALLHGYLAGYVPESIKEQEDGVREVAHRHIGFWEFLGHAVSGGPITMKEIEETEYVRARRTAQGRGVTTQGMQDAGRKRSALAVPSEKLGELIEKVDVWINKRSVRAFANAFYAASKKLNEENGNLLTEDQLRQGALQAVGRVLELGAQPLTRMQKGIFQNGSGMLGKMTFAMKSESINKLGLMSAQAVRGERVSPLVGWISLGVFNAAVTYLIAMLQGDEDDEKNTWVSHATSAGISTATGPLSAVPILSESLAELASWITGERVYSADYARQIVDAGGLARGVRKIYRHHAGVREMGWEDYFKTLTALVRASGAGFGAFSRSGSEAMSSFGSLMLSAAAGANVSRMGKDVLTRAGLFDPQKKKAVKKGQERRRTKRTGRRKAE